MTDADNEVLDHNLKEEHLVPFSARGAHMIASGFVLLYVSYFYSKMIDLIQPFFGNAISKHAVFVFSIYCLCVPLIIFIVAYFICYLIQTKFLLRMPINYYYRRSVYVLIHKKQGRFEKAISIIIASVAPVLGVGSLLYIINSVNSLPLVRVSLMISDYAYKILLGLAISLVLVGLLEIVMLRLTFRKGFKAQSV